MRSATTEPVSSAVETPAEKPQGRRALRAAAIAWPLALVGALYVAFGHLGFQPTDEGNVLAQTHRILHGQVPHQDVIFARPMGSPVLHAIDFIVPMPLFEASRLIGLAESVAYSLLLAWLVFDVSPSRWGPLRLLAAAGSALVNMHTFLLPGWYTTDGLLFTAAGFVALRAGLRSDRAWLLRAGWVSTGTAVLMKQSFLMAPVIALVWVSWTRRGRPMRRQAREAAQTALLLSAPMLLYVGVVSAFGGLGDFLQQMLGARAVWGAELVTTFGKAGPRGALLVFLGSLLGLLLIRFASSAAAGRWIRDGRRSRGAAATIVDLGVRACITVLVVRLIVNNRFAYGGSWAWILVWGVILVVIWRSAAERTLDGTGLIVALTAWMTSLSWGYWFPNLAAGAAALYIVDRAWRGASWRVPVPRAARLVVVSSGAVLALVGASVFGNAFVDARDAKPYFGPPKEALTADLVAVSPEFGGIKTNPATASYLAELTRCVRRHPARWTAVLPDNPGMYAALRLRNPFPIDWMFPAEIEGEERRILDAARRLEAAGDYTVLFQIFHARHLTEATVLRVAGPRSRPVGSPLMAEILDSLRGTRFTCGYFVGVTAAARRSS